MPQTPPEAAAPSVSSGKPYPIEKSITYERLFNSHKAYIAALDFDVEPRTHRVVMQNQRWKNAMLEEIRVLERNETWTI